MTMKQFKVCLTSLLQIDFSEFEKERLILSCSLLVDILAARKDGFFLHFFRFYKNYFKNRTFFWFIKNIEISRGRARAPRKRKDQSDAP